LGGFGGSVWNEKNGHFAERFVERFFLSVNSCMIVIFFSEKSGERKVEYIINNKKINDIFKNI
jgi:hypothetical protein